MSDSEDEDAHPSAPTPLVLSWRNDRTETHSDWTICVRRVDEQGGEEGRDVYHVHKNIIAVGSRSSEYFARMFLTAMKEQDEASTEVDLHKLQASVMPNLLDYLYAPSDEEAGSVLGLSTDKATALYSLGDYFQIVDLRKRAKAFYKTDVQLCNLKLYYEHARDLRTEKVMEHVHQVTAKTWLDIATAMASVINSKNVVSSNQEAEEDFGTFLSLARLATLSFWLPVLRETQAHWKDLEARNEFNRATQDCLSKSISVVVAEACAYCQEDSLTMEMFSKLTDPAAMPVIDVHAAFPLLSMEKTLLDQIKRQEDLFTTRSSTIVAATETAAAASDETQTGEGFSPLQQMFVQSLLSLNDDKEEDSTTPGSGDGGHTNNNQDSWILTSLQERCIDALARDWESISYDHKCVRVLMSLDNHYLICRIMVAALANAKEQVQGLSPPRRRFPWSHRIGSSSSSNKNAAPEKQSENETAFRSFHTPRAAAAPSSSTSQTAAKTPRLPQWIPNRGSQTVGEKGKRRWLNKSKNASAS